MSDELMKMFAKFNKLRLSKLYKGVRELGITGPQMFVLRELFMQSKTIGELAKAVDLSDSTVSGIVDRLERNGFVERVRDNDDRRVVWIKLKADCRELNREKFNEFGVSQDINHLFTEEEIGLIKRVLQKSIDYLEKELE